MFSLLVEDDQYEVYCTTQWMHLAQTFIASALNIQKNKVDMKVIQKICLRAKGIFLLLLF